MSDPNVLTITVKGKLGAGKTTLITLIALMLRIAGIKVFTKTKVGFKPRSINFPALDRQRWEVIIEEETTGV
jgi:hypothetical protein